MRSAHCFFYKSEVVGPSFQELAQIRSKEAKNQTFFSPAERIIVNNTSVPCHKPRQNDAFAPLNILEMVQKIVLGRMAIEDRGDHHGRVNPG